MAPVEDTPAAEIDIDVDLVRSLLREQAPERAAVPLSFLADGWDNVLYRLGTDEIVRLPRRQLGADLVEHERRWLPMLAPRLPLPVPTPVFVGRPSDDYPWSWTICPWFDGEPATDGVVADQFAAATALGEFVAALRTDAPEDAPTNPYRGIPLADRDDRTRRAIADLRDIIDATSVTAAWDRAATTPAWNGPAQWLHGDLHPGNVLVHDGRIAAVIDFGDVCGGDPATDLAVAWMLFDAPARAAFRAAARVDDATWERGQGWAIALGLAVLGSSADRPAYTRFARHALQEVVATRSHPG